MKQSITFFLRFSSILLSIFAIPNSQAYGQFVYHQVLHSSGAEVVGCTNVSVTSDGGVTASSGGSCGYGPFGIGFTNPGSYTFSFDPPISSIKFNAQTFDNHDGHVDELRVYIDGSFYPMPSAGVADGCQYPAILRTTGTIQGDPASPDGLSSFRDAIVNTTIKTLTLEDVYASGSPAGIFFSLYISCPNCETSAGQIVSVPLTLCSNQSAEVPPAQQTLLESDDMLQYILFSDETDATGSIIATSSTPSFGFNPATMSIDVTYFIAAIAGNALGGNVDLNDFCLSISNIIEVTWKVFPTVSFMSSDSCVEPGQCQSINVEFTGIPPFHLAGEVLSSGSPVTSFTETYFSSNPILLICLPANTPEGPIDIVATGLSDAHCICD